MAEKPTHPAARWRVMEVLTEHDRKPADLVRASGLGKNTVYAITGGTATAASLETIGAILGGLRRLTRAPLTVADVLTVENDAAEGGGR